MSISTVPVVPASKPSLQPSLCMETKWPPMSPYGQGLYLLLLSITGYLFAPIHHYYARIKRFLVPVCVSKDSNVVPVLDAISHTTEVVMQG